MKIILAMVISVDGKSTKWDLPDQSWASPEDKAHLSRLVSENNLILMGGKTYELAKNHIKPSAGKLRVVLTRDPKKFADDEVYQQLESTNEPIEKLIERLEGMGFEKMLLLSGESLNKEFFEKKLINEIILTVEPKIFGEGRGITAQGKFDLDLKLISEERANEQGTLFLTYEVLYK